MPYIIALAYGRDSIPDRKLYERLLAITGGDFSDVLSRIKALAAREIDFKPGVANETIAHALDELMIMDPQAIVFAQWEVAYALIYNYGNFIAEEQAARIVWLWPPDAEAFTSRRVLKAAYDEAAKRGLERYRHILLAHPDHLVRGTLLAWKLGYDPAISFAAIPFDPESVQPWVRNWYAWTWYELRARVHHIYHGWVSIWPTFSI